MQLFFRLFALGYLHNNACRADGPAIMIFEDLCRNLHPDDFPVLFDIAFFYSVLLPSLPEVLPHYPLVPIPVFGMKQSRNMHPEKFRLFISGHLAKAVINFYDSPFQIDFHGADNRILKK